MGAGRFPARRRDAQDHRRPLRSARGRSADGRRRGGRIRRSDGVRRRKAARRLPHVEGAHRRHVGDDGVGRRGRRVFVFAVQHRQDVLDGVRVGGAGVVRRGVPLLPPLGGGDDAAVRVFVPVRVEHDHGVLFSAMAGLPA